MAISLVGSAENSAINGGDVTVDLSGLGLQQNDLVIVAYAIGDTDLIDFDMAIVSPTGYTEIADLNAQDARDVNMGVFWKLMGATPDTSVVVDGQGGTNASVAAVVLAFRGVDTTTPMDVTPTTATGLNTQQANPPSINHNNPAGVWTVAVGAFSHGNGAGITLTAPTNYGNLVDRAENDTIDVGIGMATRSDPADPEDPGVFTNSGADSTNDGWCAVTIALRPAAAGAAEPFGPFYTSMCLTGIGH